MGENDYESGYRGNQFHHGMDRAEYERGQAQKQLHDDLGKMASGGVERKTEVPAVAFTLLLVAPFIWMVYPVLGVTIMVVPIVVVAIFTALKLMEWGYLLAFILGVCAFFPGMQFEHKISQFTVYRVIRGILRIIFAFVFGVAVCAGKGMHSGMGPGDLPPGAWVGGFFIAVIAYLIFQRLDIIYFPSQKEMKKMTEKILKGDRITRPLGKRLLWGFCWLIPTVVILALLEMIAIRLFMNVTEGRELFERIRPVLACINFVIWYLLCLFGRLPGTSKNRYTEKQEQDIKEILSQKSSA